MNPFLPISAQNNLVLASGSPRRKKILEGLGFEFATIESGVNEDELFVDDPIQKVRALAELKAVSVHKYYPRKKVIGADTIVICRNKELGKPADRKEAAEMLSLLSGKCHEVVTGVAVVAPHDRKRINIERTKVYFKELRSREIQIYIDTKEPFDKAGGYAIQGLAASFIKRIEGCYFNVVGLPVGLLFRMLEELKTL
jgi:septum formation protein